MRKSGFFGLFLMCTITMIAQPQITLIKQHGYPVAEISAEILRRAYLEIGYELIFPIESNSQTLEMANRGRLDGELHRISGIEDRFTHLIKIPVPINRVEIVIFTKDPEISIQTIEDLSQYNLAALTGIKVIEDLFPENNNIVWTNKRDQTFRLLDKERVSLVIGSHLNGLISLRDQGLTEISPLPLVLNEALLYHYIHDKHIDLVPDLTRILTRMLNSGEIEEIRKDFIDAMKVENPTSSTSSF